MQVRFWGVRGSCACSGEPWVRTGGNTSCVEVLHEGHRLVLDGGTGMRALGDHLGFVPCQVSVLFSHVHWDHIQGVPFFTPAYNPAVKLQILGATRESGSIRDALASQMRPPTFPVTLDTFRAQLSFADLRTGVPFEEGPFRITALDLAHPDGVLAFRIDAGGRSLVYATDVEHGSGELDRRLVDLASGVDLLVHDAQYTQAEYFGQKGPPRVGWGHSMWHQAIDTARAAGARRVALFHHDPTRSDDAVDAIEQLARHGFPESFAAREGQVVEI